MAAPSRNKLSDRLTEEDNRMKKTLLSLLVSGTLGTLGAIGASLATPALADERNQSFGITLDPLLLDTEHPAGDRSETHRPRFGIEYAHKVWSKLDLTAGAGIHRIRVEDTGSDTTLNFVDLRLGLRQYFTSRQIGSWSPYIGASISEAWLRDADSTVGGNRRYGGYSASLGIAKLLSDNTDISFWLGYTRLNAKDKRGDHTDTLATGDLGLAAAIRF